MIRNLEGLEVKWLQNRSAGLPESEHLARPCSDKPKPRGLFAGYCPISSQRSCFQHLEANELSHGASMSRNGLQQIRWIAPGGTQAKKLATVDYGQNLLRNLELLHQGQGSRFLVYFEW